MGLKIVGAGFGRTGTLSLKFALEKLGFDKCYHMFEVYQNEGHIELWRAAGRGQPMDWEALFAGVDMAFELIWNGVFDGRMEDRAHVIACYQAHNQHVKDTVTADQLLVFNPGEGWDPLCAFLGVAVPEEDYPNTNSTVEFHERRRQRESD